MRTTSVGRINTYNIGHQSQELKYYHSTIKNSVHIILYIMATPHHYHHHHLLASKTSVNITNEHVQQQGTLTTHKAGTLYILKEKRLYEYI